jgi:hypothetical protein
VRQIFRGSSLGRVFGGALIYLAVFFSITGFINLVKPNLFFLGIPLAYIFGHILAALLLGFLNRGALVRFSIALILAWVIWLTIITISIIPVIGTRGLWYIQSPEPWISFILAMIVGSTTCLIFVNRKVGENR